MSGVRARVQIMVEVDLGQPWSDDATAAQIRRQASRSAQEALSVALREVKGERAVIIGDPTVMLVWEAK